MQDFSNNNQLQHDNVGYYHNPEKTDVVLGAQTTDFANNEASVSVPIIDEPPSAQQDSNTQSVPHDNELDLSLENFLANSLKLLKKSRDDRGNLVKLIDEEEDKITQRIKEKNGDVPYEDLYGHLDDLRDELHRIENLIRSLIGIVRS